MKKILLALLVGGLMLGGCTASQPTGENKMEKNVVIKIGTIQTKIGSEYVLKTDSEMVNMASNKVNLDDYMKKTVEVKGMYSGNTLYVDEISLK